MHERVKRNNMPTFCKRQEEPPSREIVPCNNKLKVTMEKQQLPYLDDIVTKIEGRRCNLIGQHKTLREKITTLERSMPAFIAFNMLKASQSCNDSAYCRVREIMKNFSPHLDPTEKLLRDLRVTVKDLNKKTTELHDKIIDADVQLEETTMELESLELVNEEMNNQMNKLEREVRSYKTPSLHSIHSEDIVCISKIRHLANEELNLKTCIKQLEEKEAAYGQQIDQLLTSKDFQKDSNRIMKSIQQLECNEKNIHCALQNQRYNMQRIKKKLLTKDKDFSRLHDIGSETKSKCLNVEETDKKKSSWLSKLWNTDKNSTKSISMENEKDSISCVCSTTSISHNAHASEKKKLTTLQSYKYQNNAGISSVCKTCTEPLVPIRVCRPQYCCPPLKKSNSCICATESIMDLTCKKVSTVPIRLKNPCALNLPCELSEKKVELVSCIHNTPCHQLVSYKHGYSPNNINNCRCNCKGKCAQDLSSDPCNCGGSSFSPLDKGYQPTVEQKFQTSLNDNSSTDDEFCECCECKSENFDECKCN